MQGVSKHQEFLSLCKVRSRFLVTTFDARTGYRAFAAEIRARPVQGFLGCCLKRGSSYIPIQALGPWEETCTTYFCFWSDLMLLEAKLPNKFGWVCGSHRRNLETNLGWLEAPHGKPAKQIRAGVRLYEAKL